MTRVPLLLLVIPVFSTLAGGFIALRFRRSALTLIALGAGLLLGAAFLDLLPEALAMGTSAGMPIATVLGICLLAFFAFAAIQRGLDDFVERHKDSSRPNQMLGRVGGAMLIFHSLRDGMAIGLSYAASHSAGYAVAAGIAAHDIGDGMNTVILTTGGERPELADYFFLALDALAPLVGGLLTVWWVFSVKSSIWLLAIAAGFFIQMATSDFLPELRHGRKPAKHLLPTVFAGAALIYAANWLLRGLP